MTVGVSPSQAAPGRPPWRCGRSPACHCDWHAGRARAERSRLLQVRLSSD